MVGLSSSGYNAGTGTVTPSSLSNSTKALSMAEDGRKVAKFWKETLTPYVQEEGISFKYITRLIIVLLAALIIGVVTVYFISQ